MDKSSMVEIGGNVEKAINGQYVLNIGDIIKEAWQKTLLSRASINIGLIFVFSLGVLVTLILGEYFGGLEQAAADPNAFMIMQLVITVVIWPFLGGVEMMGVLHAIGVKTQLKHTFSFLKRGSWVVVCSLLTSMLVGLGLQLLIIPGVFLAVCFSLTIPLVIEKNISPFKACIITVQAVRFQWFKVFALYGILTGGLIFSLIPLIALSQTGNTLAVFGIALFLVALSFLAPLYINIKGILYREIFGLQVQSSEQGNQNSSSFIA